MPGEYSQQKKKQSDSYTSQIWFTSAKVKHISATYLHTLNNF